MKQIKISQLYIAVQTNIGPFPELALSYIQAEKLSYFEEIYVLSPSVAVVWHILWT